MILVLLNLLIQGASQYVLKESRALLGLNSLENSQPVQLRVVKKVLVGPIVVLPGGQDFPKVSGSEGFPLLVVEPLRAKLNGIQVTRCTNFGTLTKIGVNIR